MHKLTSEVVRMREGNAAKNTNKTIKRRAEIHGARDNFSHFTDICVWQRVVDLKYIAAQNTNKINSTLIL